MLIDEFINKFYNDLDYKESIQSELLNLKSSFSKQELQEHREEIKQLLSLFEFNTLIDKIDSYLLLEDNWGGYEETKPTKITIEVAKEFATVLYNKDIIPKVMIGSSGQIAFYLKVDNLYIEIELEETKYSYICVVGLTVILAKDDLDLNIIDEDLINVIKRNTQDLENFIKNYGIRNSCIISTPPLEAPSRPVNNSSCSVTPPVRITNKDVLKN